MISDRGTEQYREYQEAQFTQYLFAGKLFSRTLENGYVRGGIGKNRSLGSPQCTATTYTSLYIPIYTYIYLCIPIYTYVYLYIPMYTYIYLCIHIYTYIYLYIPMYTYIYLYIPMYTYIYLCIPIYTYIYRYLYRHYYNGVSLSYTY